MTTATPRPRKDTRELDLRPSLPPKPLARFTVSAEVRNEAHDRAWGWSPRRYVVDAEYPEVASEKAFAAWRRRGYAIRFPQVEPGPTCTCPIDAFTQDKCPTCGTHRMELLR